LYLLPQAVWLIVDLARLKARRPAASPVQPAVAAYSGHLPDPRLAATVPASANAVVSIPVAVPILPSKEPSQGELLFWQSVKDSTDPADFTAYLQQFQSGLFRQLALNKLAVLGSNSGSA
jgi:hypothetical protein